MVINDNGVQIRTLSEVTADNTTEWSNKTGEVDVSPTSASGEIIAITSEIVARVEQDVADAVTQNTISGATDSFLDSLAELKNTSRYENVPTVVYCFIEGTPGIIIPAGTPLRCSANNEDFTTVVQVTSDASGVYVAAESVNIGVSCPAGTIEFNPVISGLTITNNRDGVVGYAMESDTSLRNRLQLLGTSKTLMLKDGLFLALMDLHGVTNVNILDNQTLASVEGVPAKSFSPVVLGGDTYEIAEIVYAFSGGGNPSYGDVTQPIRSETGATYLVQFSRPTEVEIAVGVTLSVTADYDASVGDAEVRDNIANYINGLQIGDPVLLKKVAAAAMIAEVLDATIELNAVAANVILAYDELAYTTVDLVTVS
jgi:uncharacterized phage protein gp47/JayE